MKNKKNILILLIVTTIVLYLSLKDDFFGIVREISKVNIFVIFCAVIAIILVIMFRAKGLHLFIEDKKRDYKYKEAFKLTIITQFLNGITPFSTGGQPFQAYLLTKRDIKLFDTVSILVGDFVSYQFALIVLSIFAISYNAYYDLFNSNIVINKLIILGFIVNIVIMIICIFFIYSKKIMKKIVFKLINFAHSIKFLKISDNKKEKLIEEVNIFYNSARDLRNKSKIFFKSVAYNLIGLVILYLIPFIIIGSRDITVIKSIVTSSLVMLFGNFIPIPGATGGLEYCFIQFFGEFIKGPGLTSSMLLWRFFTYYLGMIVGAVTMFLSNERRKIV
ncbi:MAG TPA: lysylphosphatidylglycerol synthase transmembrane domain-containing protein [Bacilli bacterium]|nr:lysylphosphatidylglycerol synthase transmembrane domain-containing protein [Bacilli bacterium]